MGRGPRHGAYETVGPALKPRMRCAEGAVMHCAEGKPIMTLAGTAQSRQQQLIRELKYTVAAQAERLRWAESALFRTQGRLGAATRKLKKKEAAAERAERAQAELATQLELCRQELAALREKHAAVEGQLSGAGEKEAEAERAERAREQTVVRLERALQEQAATAAALREKDSVIGGLRARLAEKGAAAERAERTRSQAAESAPCAQQELAAAGSAMRNKDAMIDPNKQQMNEIEDKKFRCVTKDGLKSGETEDEEKEEEKADTQALGEAHIRSPRAAQIPPETGEAPAGGHSGCGARERLQQFVDAVPIGGNPESTSERHYDVGPLVRFAEGRGLDTSDPEEVIRQYTHWQMERAAAAVCTPDVDASAAARRSLLRTPSPRPEAAGWRRRLGAPRCASDDSWTDATCSLPASPAAAAAAPAEGGASRWLAHLPPVAQLPAVGRQLAAAAAEAAAAALPSAGQRRGRPSPAEASGARPGPDCNDNEEDGVLV